MIAVRTETVPVTPLSRIEHRAKASELFPNAEEQWQQRFSSVRLIVHFFSELAVCLPSHLLADHVDVQLQSVE
jgi:hypothetical protein